MKIRRFWLGIIGSIILVDQIIGAFLGDFTFINSNNIPYHQPNLTVELIPFIFSFILIYLGFTKNKIE